MSAFLTFLACVLAVLAIYHRSWAGLVVIVCGFAFAHHEYGVQTPALATKVASPFVQLHDRIRGHQDERTEEFICGAAVVRATRDEHHGAIEQAARRCPDAVRPTRSDAAMME